MSKATEILESVKLKKKIVDKVRNSKKKTGVPITTFFELAAEEKLLTIKKQSS